MQIWMPGVERVPARAKGGMPFKPVAVMSHIMQGYQSTMIRWAQENPVKTFKSAHFTINRAGRIVQHVPLNEASWAAGAPNNPTWPLLPSPTQSVNRAVVNIEHEGFSKPPSYGFDYIYSDARPWPPAMLEASIRVHTWVFQRLGITKANKNTVIGHRDTDSVTRADDPGWQWPQETVILKINEELRPPVSPPHGETDYGKLVERLALLEMAFKAHKKDPDGHHD